MDELERRLGDQVDAHRGIPLQFGPGLKTIWPSSELSNVERRLDACREQIRRAQSLAEFKIAFDDLVRAGSEGMCTVLPHERHHVNYLVQAFTDEARHRAQALRYSEPRPPFYDQQRSDAQAFLEAYNRSRAPVAWTIIGGIVASQASAPAPVVSRVTAQGMARPNGWTGGGKFPGYVMPAADL